MHTLEDPVQAAEYAIKTADELTRDIEALSKRLGQTLPVIREADDRLIRNDPKWNQSDSPTKRLKKALDSLEHALVNLPRSAR